MHLPKHKTKIVCTIGPSTSSVSTIEALIKAGMSVARLNFSHGTLLGQKEIIRNIRKAASNQGCVVGIIIDLPGAKMRVGKIASEPLMLKSGEKVVLSSKNRHPGRIHIPVEYRQLAKSVSKGSVIYLDDGFIQLQVESVKGDDVLCKVTMGGPLISHKGLNLPGAKLFVDPVTSTDFKMIEFGLQQGITVFGLSFVEKAADVNKVREFIRKKGLCACLVAKIERQEAVNNFEEIVKVSDGVMIARGDLGLEIPIEEVPVVQKRLIRLANVLGKPVITATQMLESMTENIRPTRAEVNDVANAILDGSDAVMLSGETAIGHYPVEAVQTMAGIAAFTEAQRENGKITNDAGDQIKNIVTDGNLTITDVISLNAARAVEKLQARYVCTPTSSGSTARRISRFKPSCWILSFSPQKDVCNFLIFSYGVHPFTVRRRTDARPDAIFKKLNTLGWTKKGDIVVITERRLSDRTGETDSLAIVTI